jgi:hypothetical protein
VRVLRERPQRVGNANADWRVQAAKVALSDTGELDVPGRAAAHSS